jgi:hypothetical protein
MLGPRFVNTPLPVQGRCIGIAGRVAGQQGDDSGPLIVNLDHITFIPAVNIQSPAGSPSNHPRALAISKRGREKLRRVKVWVKVNLSWTSDFIFLDMSILLSILQSDIM